MIQFVFVHMQFIIITLNSLLYQSVFLSLTYTVNRDLQAMFWSRESYSGSHIKAWTHLEGLPDLSSAEYRDIRQSEYRTEEGKRTQSPSSYITFDSCILENHLSITICQRAEPSDSRWMLTVFITYWKLVSQYC